MDNSLPCHPPPRFSPECHLHSRGMAGVLTEDTLTKIVDVNGTNFFEAANSVGYGGKSIDEMLKGTLVPKGRVSHFVELHIEQVRNPPPHAYCSPETPLHPHPNRFVPVLLCVPCLIDGSGMVRTCVNHRPCNDRGLHLVLCIQGPLLERHGLNLGLVTAIAAPATIRVQFLGNGGHAGALLMPFRKDAGEPTGTIRNRGQMADGRASKSQMWVGISRKWWIGRLARGAAGGRVGVGVSATGEDRPLDR